MTLDEALDILTKLDSKLDRSVPPWPQDLLDYLEAHGWEFDLSYESVTTPAGEDIHEDWLYYLTKVDLEDLPLYLASPRLCMEAHPDDRKPEVSWHAGCYVTFLEALLAYHMEANKHG
jgi:hypothetical protein